MACSRIWTPSADPDETFDDTFANPTFNPIITKSELSTRGGANLQTDLPVLIELYLKYGPNHKKALKKMSESEKEQIAKLTRRYNIRCHIHIHLTPTSITLSRIIACYPGETVYAVFKNPNLYGGPVHPEKYTHIPIFMFLPCFPSVVPAGLKDITESLLEHHFNMMKIIDRVVHTWDQKFTTEENLKDYQKAAFEFEALKEEKRISVLISCQLIQQDQTANCGYVLTKTWRHLRKPKRTKKKAGESSSSKSE